MTRVRSTEVLDVLAKARRPVTIDELAQALDRDYRTETFGMLIWHLWMTGRIQLDRQTRNLVRLPPPLNLVCANPKCRIPLDPVIPAQGWTMHPSCSHPGPTGRASAFRSRR